MGFLSRSSTMSKQEARDILRLVDAIRWCEREQRPMPLLDFVEVFQSRSEVVEHHERAVRRVQSRLAQLGYRVHVTGKKDALLVDFSVDPELRRHVMTEEACANATLTKTDSSPTKEPQDLQEQDVRLRQLAFELRATVRSICRDLNIRDKDRVQRLLRAIRRPPLPARRERVEERVSPQTVERALDAGEQEKQGRAARASSCGLNVSAVARVLGCDRSTAREFVRRMDRANRRGKSLGLSTSGHSGKSDGLSPSDQQTEDSMRE